jgi:argininosuccinate lyase
MSKPLWAGAYQSQADEELASFWNSIGFDVRLTRYDLYGSLAHVEMLGQTGIVSKDEAAEILNGLVALLRLSEQTPLTVNVSDEDIHMNIERLLTENLGAVAGKLHTGRSRNDQVALDMHMFVRDTALELASSLLSFCSALAEIARNHLNAVMPGYTHLQRAQPVSFAHHLLAYAWMGLRDAKRYIHVSESANQSPLGAGALAGSPFPLDRAYVAERLGFKSCYPNSMDAVSDRDYVAEILFADALVAAHLSRFCEDIILWASAEFKFVRLPEAYTSGSSMMPQKRNPDLAELVRGKTGRVYGSLFGLLTVLKGVPMTYNKDLQEDKEGLFDSVDTIASSLKHLTRMLGGVEFNFEKAKVAVGEGFMNATDLADHLAANGVPFRQAHEAVAKLVKGCSDRGITLNDLSAAELEAELKVDGGLALASIDLDSILESRSTFGGTSPKRVQEQLDLFDIEHAGLTAKVARMTFTYPW